MGAKNIAKDMKSHTDDIHSIAMTTDRKLVVTGQVGHRPIIMIWGAIKADMKRCIRLPKGSRSACALGFSECGKYLTAVDMHNDHNVHLIEVASGQIKWSQKGGPDKILDVAWSLKSQSDLRFCTVGIKHVFFWTYDSQKKSRGITNRKVKLTNFLCVAFDPNGIAYTGGQNGTVYTWNGNNCRRDPGRSPRSR